ncbi:MAG: hypothetical protein KAJ11_07110, partial [Alphaproteobacteria bacterium]|nr:hypothetical protein [Alphaproteobacteria bacterium]
GLGRGWTKETLPALAGFNIQRRAAVRTCRSRYFPYAAGTAQSVSRGAALFDLNHGVLVGFLYNLALAGRCLGKETHTTAKLKLLEVLTQDPT